MKLIHKSNAEYYRDTILVGNCNDTLSINSVRTSPSSNAFAIQKVHLSEDQPHNKIT